MWRGRTRDLENHMQNYERPIHVLTETESAQLIAKVAHGLLTGPCAVAFMRQTALGQGAELMAKDLMGVAESLAMESIKRGFSLSSFSYKLASEEHTKRAQEAEELRGLFVQGKPAQGALGASNDAE